MFAFDQNDTWSSATRGAVTVIGPCSISPNVAERAVKHPARAVPPLQDDKTTGTTDPPIHNACSSLHLTKWTPPKNQYQVRLNTVHTTREAAYGRPMWSPSFQTIEGRHKTGSYVCFASCSTGFRMTLRRRPRRVMELLVTRVTNGLNCSRIGYSRVRGIGRACGVIRQAIVA